MVNGGVAAREIMTKFVGFFSIERAPKNYMINILTGIPARTCRGRHDVLPIQTIIEIVVIRT